MSFHSLSSISGIRLKSPDFIHNVRSDWSIRANHSSSDDTIGCHLKSASLRDHRNHATCRRSYARMQATDHRCGQNVQTLFHRVAETQGKLQSGRPVTICCAGRRLGPSDEDGKGSEEAERSQDGAEAGRDLPPEIKSTGSALSDRGKKTRSTKGKGSDKSSAKRKATGENKTKSKPKASGPLDDNVPEPSGDASEPLENSWKTLFAAADDAFLGPEHGLAGEPVLADTQPIRVLGMGGGGWCSLCGVRSGWSQCGACNGTGGFATMPGKAGVSGIVGWARCKTCFGRTVVPCQLCGIPDPAKWHQWLEHARRWPIKTGTGSQQVSQKQTKQGKQDEKESNEPANRRGPV